VVEAGSSPLHPREKATLTAVNQYLGRGVDMLLFLIGGVSGEGHPRWMRRLCACIPQARGMVTTPPPPSHPPSFHPIPTPLGPYYVLY